MSVISNRNTVRWNLVALVLAVMLPTLAAAVATIGYVYTQERNGFERGLSETTRALKLVVDREFAGREALLRTLAESPALTRGDLEIFHAYAKAVAPTPDKAIVLSTPDGRTVLNSRRPFGEPLPEVATRVFRRAAEPMAPVVTDLFFANLGQQYSFAVEVPVVREGKVIYYLAMGQFADQLQQVLLDQHLPSGWIGTIVDRKDQVVARNVEPARFIGTRAREEVLQKLEQAHGEPVQIRALDGSAVVAAYSRSTKYGWAVFVGVPQAQITTPAKAAQLFGAIAAVLLVASLLAALQLGRRMVEPVITLADAAAALGRGEPVQLGPTGLRETDVVANALRAASVSLSEAKIELEQRVSAALDDAERAHQSVIRSQRLEAVGQLTGGVAHDFNNLLMVVGTNVHLLQGRHSELAGDAQLARIERAVATGTKLTRQLLSFARRQPLRPQRVDLAQALPEMLDLVRPTLGGSISARCEIEPALACVLIDPAEFELAIINLSINARDAMPGGGQLRVWAHAGTTATALPATAATVVIEVSDSGVGIDRALLDRVFEPFFTTKAVGSGTGLGLSQVYGMATQAGGTVQISSEAGKGTTVRIVLPAADPAGPREQRDQPSPPAQKISGTLLLVEDNPELAQVTRELLEMEGFQVHGATDADDALRQLARLQPPPQLVLSDIRMPGNLDGIGLAAHLQQHSPNLPVVLMTGYTSELEAARALGLEVLAKPVAAGELIEVLRRTVKALPPESGGAAIPPPASEA